MRLMQGGTIDEDADAVKARLAEAIKHLAATFPDPQKASDDLTKFAGMNDQRIYKLLKTLSDPATDFKTLIKNLVSGDSHRPGVWAASLHETRPQQEVQRKIETASSSIVNTFTLFIYRSSYLLLNRSSVPFLVKKLQSSNDDKDAETQCAKLMLDAISKSCPEMIRPHAADLVKLLSTEDNETLVNTALFALSELARKDPEAIPTDKCVLIPSSCCLTR